MKAIIKKAKFCKNNIKYLLIAWYVIKLKQSLIYNFKIEIIGWAWVKIPFFAIKKSSKIGGYSW